MKVRSPSMTNTLNSIPKTNNLHHAYLISHHKSHIQKQLSFKFVHTLLDLSKINHENHPDFLFLEPTKEKFGISLIRKIILYLSRKPYHSNRKVVLIHEAHILTIEAQNALLKTLEEPPENSILILTTNHQENILPTILSRCERLIFQKPSNKVEKSENYRKDSTFFEEIIEQNLTERFLWVFENYQNDNIQNILENWLCYNRKLLIDSVTNTYPIEKKLANKLFLNINNIQHTINLLKRNANPRLTLENTMLQFNELPRTYVHGIF